MISSQLVDFLVFVINSIKITNLSSWTFLATEVLLPHLLAGWFQRLKDVG